MPVIKFRSVHELDKSRRDLWCERPDDAWFQRIARLWARSARLNPRRFAPGVRRYRSVEEAQCERELWLRQHVEALRQRRGN